ncbi:CotH kinase family protein [Flavobacterium sp. MAH-1]|uniref:CotH kinase family protein n=2 Tax=Flavobacterium agri TaxID=2743471 RepID=A0A7Y8Y454_9FLAO|nr:CotH kinase family protein [Flavobacterium agri]NYA72037.1 CotH kinase family protein [Flavobacterium agri]
MGNVSAQNFTDSNLPIVIINTDINPNTGQPTEIPDDPRVLATMKIIKHPDGSRNYMTDQNNAAYLNYNGRINIEIRGSTSQLLEKKPYGLTTLLADNVSNNNVSLLGMPSENDWVLNSFAFDESLIRDYISYNLARAMGNYAPRIQYCEVVVNGDYRGLYLLQEKVKSDSNRVNIVKITDADNAMPNLTGGYITKADKTTGDDPVAWNMASYNGDVAYIHDLPKPEDVTAAQDTYIHGQFSSLQLVAGAGNSTITNGFPSKIDIPTFVDYMISSELASNVDSYQFSTYFHKDRGGKLRAGPIWDYNLTYGNDLGEPSRSGYDVWQFDNDDNTGSKFWKDLFDNPTFKCYLSKRFHDLTQPGQPLRHQSLVALIDETVALISEAEAREDQRWNSIWNWTAEIDDLKTWLNSRITWMTNHLGAYTACSNVAVPQLVINRINYNPSTSSQFPVSNDQEFIEIKNAGSTTVTLTGIYFSQLGISYQFPNNSTLAAGQSAYIASNMTTFQSRYGFAAFGQFTRNLSNNSQKLMLSDAWGNVIDLVEYDDESPWPNADGNGSYLQLISTSLDNSLASSWMASSASLGTQDFAIASLVLYPNPVRNIFTVNSSARIDGVQVFDSLGRIVKSTTANSETVEVDANDLVQGVYLVKITSGHASKTVSIVKQ